MKGTMHFFSTWNLLISILIFAAVPLFLEFGRKLGKWQIKKRRHGEIPSSGTLENTIFAILGLMIGFTFLGAAERYDMRKRLIVDEANLIQTAYLRIDILPSHQEELRDLLKKYLDSRILSYTKLPDMEAAFAEYAHSQELQQQMWTVAVESTRETASPVPASLMLPALNDVSDIATTRVMAGELHPPMIVYFLLISLILIGSVLAGYANAAKPRRGWLHVFVYAGILALSFYVIIDLENLRDGLIQIDSFDRVLVDLRKSMD